ncbi:unnamed protein product [Moneuplotes crassus]|uniref:Uncharacterized protein n=1 Tax=Euplotes crassus TaxID=5936 RepID=A0AAD1XTV0_EUPCR|nr:unnamed protein product [Moneuplotes crassus]
MGAAYSTLKWKFKGGKAYNEYALQQETEGDNADILDTVCKQYYYVEFKQGRSDYISLFLDKCKDKQALSKIEKLAPQAMKLEYIAFSRIQKNDRKLSRLIGQLRVNKLKRLYFTAKYPGSVQAKSCMSKELAVYSILFSFYARDIVRLLPLAHELIEIINFRVSHRDFGRVIVSCVSSPTVLFQQCCIVINGFDYLDNVKPSIKRISLNYNTIIQPEEDNEDLDGLIQKMSESSLNDSLKQITVLALNSIEIDKAILARKEYTIRNFRVRIW